MAAHWPALTPPVLLAPRPHPPRHHQLGAVPVGVGGRGAVQLEAEADERHAVHPRHLLVCLHERGWVTGRGTAGQATGSEAAGWRGGGAVGRDCRGEGSCGWHCTARRAAGAAALPARLPGCTTPSASHLYSIVPNRPRRLLAEAHRVERRVGAVPADDGAARPEPRPQNLHRRGRVVHERREAGWLAGCRVAGGLVGWLAGAGGLQRGDEGTTPAARPRRCMHRSLMRSVLPRRPLRSPGTRTRTCSPTPSRPPTAPPSFRKSWTSWTSGASMGWTLIGSIPGAWTAAAPWVGGVRERVRGGGWQRERGAAQGGAGRCRPRHGKQPSPLVSLVLFSFLPRCTLPRRRQGQPGGLLPRVPRGGPAARQALPVDHGRRRGAQRLDGCAAAPLRFASCCVFAVGSR